MNIQTTIDSLVSQKDLSADEMTQVMHAIMRGETTTAQIAAFLTALRMKGETITEISSAVNVMRSLATPCPIADPNVIDIVGTGGDGAQTFNISTATAFVTAAAGGIVAKHGNRSVSSKSGSADVLEAAGVNLNLNPKQVATCVKKIGIGFMFAPKHHSAMRHAITARREIGIRTLFNVLGPLTNPANAKKHVIGVYSKHWLRPLAEVLQQCGSTHALVVHADDGLDELSISANTLVAELKAGKIKEYTLNPEDFGIKKEPLDSLQVHNPQQSLQMINAVLANQQGAAREIVLLNSAAAIYTAGLAEDINEGLTKAKATLENGQAQEKLQQLIELSQELSHESS